MRKYFLLSLILSVGTGLYAQFQYDNQWVFSFENDTSSILDFRGDSLIVRKVFQDMKIDLTNGCISDFNGEFLFYSNGCQINNSEFKIMSNGEGLNPGSIADDNCDFGYPSIHQSLLILPDDTDSLFYMFHKRIIVDANTEILIVNDSLFLTIVDITKNNGLGTVLQKNIPINTQLLSNAFLNAVKKTNENGWWIISAVYNSNEYELYHLDYEGNIQVKNQNIGPVIDETDNILQTILSPKGDLYVRAFSDRGIFLYDFDRELGELSNSRHIPFTIEPRFGGAAISSNGRFLYVNSLLEIWQFDLEAGDVESSKTLIATYDGFQSPYSTTFFNPQLGPDCKLYYNSNNGSDILHIMHNPNVKGTACNFEQHGVQLFSSRGVSIPYFPSYRLDTNYPICDTTKLVSTSIIIPIRPQSQIWAASPNPTAGIFYLATNNIIQQKVEIYFYDASGRLLFSKQLTIGTKSIELDLTDQFSGIYFYQVIGEDGSTASGRVVKY